MQPTSSTHTHPDQASCAAFILSKQLSCLRFCIVRCRVRSLAMSRSQSIVWKSSYWPIPGGRSSKVSIRLVDPEKIAVHSHCYALIPGGRSSKVSTRLVDPETWKHSGTLILLHTDTRWEIDQGVHKVGGPWKHSSTFILLHIGSMVLYSIHGNILKP